MARLAKKEAARYLARVPEENVFRCNDGCVMADMKELAQELREMSEETYAYHANEAKNDFRNWIKDIIGDNELANNLGKAMDRAEAAKYVADRVAFLSRAA